MASKEVERTPEKDTPTHKTNKKGKAQSKFADVAR
jgi:hypothetical protein